MSEIPQAMALLEAAFEEHAGKDGDATSLTKKELAQMLRCAFPSASGAKFDKFFNDLDANGDGVVDFQEYVTFVAAITAMSKCHK